MVRYGEMQITSLPLTGGVDEISPSNKVDPKRAAKMQNFRLSKDGSRIQKRLGLSEEVTNFAVDVFGYTTYYNQANIFCELAVIESGIHRKVTGGSWAEIHAFIVGATPTNIAHPVVPIEVQGKQLIVTEINSRMVHYDGNDYQIGISAPTGITTESLPVASETYSTAETPPCLDLMNYADQAAMDAVWADEDSGGTSSYDTSDPDSLAGPDADSKYMRLVTDGLTQGQYARRSRTLSVGIGDVFTIEAAMYFDGIGHLADETYFEIAVFTGHVKIQIRFGASGVWLMPLSGLPKRISNLLVRNKWDTWKFVVDGADHADQAITCYVNDENKGTYTYFYPNSSSVNKVQLTTINGPIATSPVPEVHIDNFKLYNRTASQYVLEGAYRYAVTYYRGGNYPCESNPLYSTIGSVTFAGGGTNDMTVSGTYTGANDKSIVVKVLLGSVGGGVKDIIQWSQDGGATWSVQMACCSTMYMPFGLVLAFPTTTTGHTTNATWTFPVKVCAGMPTIQEITLTYLPVSADSQVTARKIYRTIVNGTDFYYLTTINDNVTTTMVDNMPDSYLGALLETDRDVMPNGEFSAWWEDRLWVTGDDIIYYSALRYPEHFSLSTRYLTIQKGTPNDEITGLKAYKDSLYVFRKKSIYAIQKTTLGYGVYLVCQDSGCRASSSIVEVNSLLMFVSDRGIEIFNGVDVYPVCPSDIIERTIGAISSATYKYITAVHHKQFYEVWFTVPDSSVTIVYHYPTNEFYFFTFYKTISCMASVFDANGKRVTKVGTRDGYLDLTESGYRDNTTAITAIYRKGWLSTVGYNDVRRLDVEYEIPTGMALTSNVYVNFDKDAARTDTHAGATLDSTDIELRRPIYDFSELGQRAKYFSVELTNAENLGGELKINDIKLYHRDRSTKGRVVGD